MLSTPLHWHYRRYDGAVHPLNAGRFFVQKSAATSKLEEPALRVEVVKALLKLDPKNGERIRETLPEDQRFMLYLRRAEEKELMVETDRQDGKDKLARAPRLDQPRTAPTAPCRCEEN